MFDAFDCLVVGVCEPGFEMWWDGADGEAVVLSSDVAAVGVYHDAGLVLASVAEFEFVGVAACCEG